MWKIKCVLRESTFHVKKKKNIFRQIMKNWGENNDFLSSSKGYVNLSELFYVTC